MKLFRKYWFNKNLFLIFLLTSLKLLFCYYCYANYFSSSLVSVSFSILDLIAHMFYCEFLLFGILSFRKKILFEAVCLQRHSNEFLWKQVMTLQCLRSYHELQGLGLLGSLQNFRNKLHHPASRMVLLSALGVCLTYL